jgi:hypothetical protein
MVNGKKKHKQIRDTMVAYKLYLYIYPINNFEIKVVGVGDARMSDLYELPCTSTYIKIFGSVIIIIF